MLPKIEHSRLAEKACIISTLTIHNPITLHLAPSTGIVEMAPIDDIGQLTWSHGSRKF